MEAEHKVFDSSLKSILNISLPLIISALSGNLLYLIDRMILAYYSVDSMNAAAISGNFVAMFTFMFCAIAGVAEIYVGQNNGQKAYDKLAVPVWQMIYFSLLGFVILFPFGYFIEYINFLPDYCREEGTQYQRILIYCCSLPALKMAFASFFIGQGKTKIISYSVLLGAILNVILDVLFIFGYKDLVPEMGCRGAAIATVLAEIVQIVILAVIFFNKNNRQRYGTVQHFRFNKLIFKGCIKLGYPMAIGRIFELSAWYVVYLAISYVSKEQAIVQGICVSVYIFFAFICDGLSKSAATISSNFIGSRDLASIRNSIKTFCKIILVLGAVIAIPLAIFPRSIFFFFDMFHEDISELYPIMTVIFRLLVINITLEAMAAMLWGILMSGGDTRYPMLVNLSALWGIVVIPIIAMYYFGILQTALVVYWLTFGWCVVVLCIFYKRYLSLKWYNLLKS